MGQKTDIKNIIQLKKKKIIIIFGIQNILKKKIMNLLYIYLLI